MLGDAFLKTVKAVLVELLSKVLNLYSKEICCGCQVNHPSQIQHKCLGEIQDYFYLMHYEELTKRLWRDRFVPQFRHLCVSEYRIRGACKALLSDLKTIRRINKKISRLYSTLTGGDAIKIKALKQAEDFWLGESW